MLIDEGRIIKSDIFCRIRSSFEKQKLFPSLIFESSCLELSDIFSKLISRMFFCETHSSCGNCRGCRLFDEGRISDFLEIQTESNVIKLEDISSVSSHFLLSPSYNSYRVIFIHEVEKLGIAATNSLLKIVEELPDRCILIMSSSCVSRILPTFLSRCVILNIGTGLIETNLFDIYPFLSEDLIERVENIIENLLIKKEDTSNLVEELYNNYSKLGVNDLCSLVHICLNKTLKKYCNNNGMGADIGVDNAKLIDIMRGVSNLKKNGLKTLSLNSRLSMENILV